MADYNRDTYNQFIVHYTPYVIAVILKIGGSQLTNEDREEIASDVFVKLWYSREEISIAPGKEKAYIGVMTRHMTLNVLKKKGQSRTIPLEENSIVVSSDALEQQLISKEENKVIKEVVNTLDEPDREIFIRRYFYFEKVIEISKVMHIKEQTVATKLYRGRERLRKMLKERGIVG